MTLREQLCAVKTLIQYPEQWYQGWFAANLAGHGVFPTDPTACRWCLMGAISHCISAEDDIQNVVQHLAQCIETLDFVLVNLPRINVSVPMNQRISLTQINDHLGFAAVHQLLDLAIQKTE